MANVTITLLNAQAIPSSGDIGPGEVTCTDTEAPLYIQAGYATWPAAS